MCVVKYETFLCDRDPNLIREDKLHRKRKIEVQTWKCQSLKPGSAARCKSQKYKPGKEPPVKNQQSETDTYRITYDNDGLVS